MSAEQRPATRQQERALMRELRNRIDAAGCFRPTPWAYGLKIGFAVVTIALGYVALLGDLSPVLRVSAALLVAFASVQAGFVAHDVGDGAVTSNRRLSSGLRHLLTSFASAVSASYFHYLHRVHHITVQRGARGLGSGNYAVNPYEIHLLKRLVAWNGILFGITTVCLRGLTFKLESVRYVLRNWPRAKTDGLLMGAHALVWLVLPVPFIGIADAAINYTLITLFAGPYVGTVLVLNHEGMSQVDKLSHLSLLERVTASTRNLGSSRFSDFIFGGVNNHIEHHLFPHVPTTRLRQARAVTQAFMRERGIAYQETGFWSALAEAAKHFRSVPTARLVAEALS